MAAVMIGVDPHKATHTAVAISAAEEPLGELQVRACAAQAGRLLAWAAAWPQRTWAVEAQAQSKSATEKARASGQIKKQVVPPDSLEEVFDLNMQLEELRMQKKAGEDHPALIEEVRRQKLELQEKYEALLAELKNYWKESDEGQAAGGEEDRRKARDKWWTYSIAGTTFGSR